MDGSISARGEQLFLGEYNTAGSWKIEKDGTELQFERHDGGYSVVGKLDSNGLFYGTGLKALDATGLSFYEKDGNLGIYIDDDGKVAIGTNTILTNFTVNGASGITINGTLQYANLDFKINSSAKWSIYYDDVYPSKFIIFDSTVPTNAMYFLDGGDVVINRFTMLGETVTEGTATAIKTTVLDGTTTAAQTTVISWADADTKILSINGVINSTTLGWVGPGMDNGSNWDWSYRLINTDIVLYHAHANLQDKTYRLIVIYKE